MPSNLGHHVTTDWNCADPTSDSYIINKPLVSAFNQISADWNATTGVAVILNKPVIGGQGPAGTIGPAVPVGPTGPAGPQGPQGIRCDWTTRQYRSSGGPWNERICQHSSCLGVVQLQSDISLHSWQRACCPIHDR